MPHIQWSKKPCSCCGEPRHHRRCMPLYNPHWRSLIRWATSGNGWLPCSVNPGQCWQSWHVSTDELEHQVSTHIRIQHIGTIASKPWTSRAETTLNIFKNRLYMLADHIGKKPLLNGHTLAHACTASRDKHQPLEKKRTTPIEHVCGKRQPTRMDRERAEPAQRPHTPRVEYQDGITPPNRWTKKPSSALGRRPASLDN